MAKVIAKFIIFILSENLVLKIFAQQSFEHIFLKQFLNAEDYNIHVINSNLTRHDLPLTSPHQVLSLSHLKGILPMPASCQEKRPRKAKPNLPKRPGLFIVHVSSMNELNQFVKATHKTMTNCQDEIDPGIYQGKNAFIMVLSKHVDTALVFTKDRSVFQRHRYVAAATPVKGGFDKSFVIKVYDIYVDSIKTSSVLNIGQSIELQELFPTFDMQGFSFLVGNLPYTYFTSVDFVENISDPRRQLTNRKGSEIEAMNIICEKLNCTLDYINTLDFTWGVTNAGVAPTGLLGDLVNGTIHMTTGMTLDWDSSHITEHAAGLQIDIAGCAVSKKPKPLRSALDILKPFTLNVWIALSCTLMGLPMLIYLFEKCFGDRCLHQKYELSKTIWFIFGALLGENVDKDNKYMGNSSWAVRSLIGLFLLFALLVTSSYSGNLKAFKLNPRMENPINSLEDLVQSGVEWHMYDYQDNFEAQLLQQTEEKYKIFLEKRKFIAVWEEFPYKELIGAYEGQSIFVDAKIVLDLAIEALFGLNGKSEVYISEPHIVYSLTCVLYYPMFPFMRDFYLTAHLFHPLNPWSSRFHHIILMLRDSGLHNQMLERGKRDVISKYRSLGKSVEIHPSSPVQATSFAELANIVYMMLVAQLTGVMVLLVEMRGKGMRRTRRIQTELTL